MKMCKWRVFFFNPFKWWIWVQMWDETREKNLNLTFLVVKPGFSEKLLQTQLQPHSPAHWTWSTAVGPPEQHHSLKKHHPLSCCICSCFNHTLCFFCAKISSISRLLIPRLGIVGKQKCANGSLDGCQLLLLPGWTFPYRGKDPTGVVFGTALLPAHSFCVYDQIIFCPWVSSLKKYVLSIYYE